MSLWFVSLFLYIIATSCEIIPTRSFNCMVFKSKFLKEQTYFLIFALGNDIQLALAAIFNVIVFKRCVELCES